MAASLQIVVEDDAGRRRAVPFAQDEIAVGRDAAGNGLCLPERNVSRRHARFVRSNGAVFVEDLDSTNGTLVNGERLAGRRRIREGDLVQIGDYDLALEGSEDRPHERDTGPTEDAARVPGTPGAAAATRPRTVGARAPAAPGRGLARPSPHPARPEAGRPRGIVPAVPPPSFAPPPPAPPAAALEAPPAEGAPWRRASFYLAVGAVSTLVGWAAGSVLNLLRGP